MASSFGLLMLRVAFGGSMLLHHGWDKFLGREKMAEGFLDPLGVGHVPSFWLTIGAEVVAAAAIALGLFTRVAALGLAFAMGVAFFVVHKEDPMAKKELALLYMAGVAPLIFTGGGAYSLDALLFKKKSGGS